MPTEPVLVEANIATQRKWKALVERVEKEGKQTVDRAGKVLTLNALDKLRKRAGFWGERYAPVFVEDLDYGRKTMDRALRLCCGGSFPHLLFVGPAGAGKRTRVLALLRSMFGEWAVDGTAKTTEFNIEGVQFPAIHSSVHTELDVLSSFKGSKDKVVIDKLMNSDEVSFRFKIVP